MGTRSDPNKQRFPALRGKIIIDSYRGQMRSRSWPRKTGTPKSATVRALNTWFTGANRMAKQVVPRQQALAIAQAKGTGLYPRDLLVKSIYGGMFDMVTEDGRLIQHRVFQVKDVMFQGTILELTAPQAMAGGVNNIVVWPLPVLDTLGFWNVTAPTRLTVPVGVSVVEFTARCDGVSNPGGPRAAFNIWKNGAVLGRMTYRWTSTPAATCVTGPTMVVAGDFFEAIVFNDGGYNLAGDPRCAFMVNILQAP